MVRNIPVSNGIDEIYRPPLHLRNGIHEYREMAHREMSPPLNNHVENFGRRSEYDEDLPPSNVLRNVIDRPPELTESRVEDKRILKPAPLQARLLSVVEPGTKDSIKRFYVIPEKKFVVIKNEPTETLQVSVNLVL